MACPARGQRGPGNLGLHSRKDKRFICTACRTPFNATTGTAFSRLRTAAETVARIVTVRAHGCPGQALVAAFGGDERTIAAWWARSGRQGQAVQEHLVEQPRDLGQVHADERRVKQQGGIGWMALAIMVKPRVWLGGEGSAQRDLALLRRRSARGRRRAAQRPLLSCTDGLVSSIRAMRETLRDPAPQDRADGPGCAQGATSCSPKWSSAPSDAGGARARRLASRPCAVGRKATA
jgi:transposase-like protein